MFCYYRYQIMFVTSPILSVVLNILVYIKQANCLISCTLEESMLMTSNVLFWTDTGHIRNKECNPNNIPSKITIVNVWAFSISILTTTIDVRAACGHSGAELFRTVVSEKNNIGQIGT